MATQKPSFHLPSYPCTLYGGDTQDLVGILQGQEGTRVGGHKGRRMQDWECGRAKGHKGGRAQGQEDARLGVWEGKRAQGWEGTRAGGCKIGSMGGHKVTRV